MCFCAMPNHSVRSIDPSIVQLSPEGEVNSTQLSPEREGNSGEHIPRYTAISREVVRKMCTRQSRKVIWDMRNTLFPTVAVEPTFVAFL